MRNITGQVVRKDDFFERVKVIKKLWKQIQKGNHILLTAPRRTGKTSLLRYLEDHPQEGYLFLYVLVQSAPNEHEYYKRLVESLYSSEFISTLKKAGNLAVKFWNVFKDNVESVESIGLKLKDTEKRFSYQDIEKLLENLDLNCKLVLVIDEFPDVLEIILVQQGKEAALQFLKDNRTLCQNQRISEKVQFIYTGSIGLDNVAQKISASGLINTLSPMTILPMKEEEGEELVNKLIKGNNVEFKLNPEQIQYLLKRIEWLMPYYIQLLFQEIDDYCSEHEVEFPTHQDIDQAFDHLFAHHNRKNFSHWEERLSKFEKIERDFIKECLNKMSTQVTLSRNKIFDLSQSPKYLHHIQEAFIVNSLIHDGYIHETEPNSKIFRFNSPILKEWWKRYVVRN